MASQSGYSGIHSGEGHGGAYCKGQVGLSGRGLEGGWQRTCSVRVAGEAEQAESTWEDDKSWLSQETREGVPSHPVAQISEHLKNMSWF